MNLSNQWPQRILGVYIMITARVNRDDGRNNADDGFPPPQPILLLIIYLFDVILLLW